MEERLAAIPTWRRQPYRVFFPVGFVLTWAGVLHWVLVAVGLMDGYHAVFHSIAQVQGFLMSFALGFLFTAIPRRTQTTPPAAWHVLVGASCLVATVVAAWLDRVGYSQVFWFGAVFVLVAFVVTRFREARAGRAPPPSFVWIPISLLTGVLGSILSGIGGAFEDELWHLHELGRLLLLQGMFLGLILGVGGMVVPLITRGESVADAGAANRRLRRAHLATAAALIGTFCLEEYGSAVWAHAARTAVLVLALVLLARAHRLPTRPGRHRWLVWAAIWALPIGYAVAALLPDKHQVGLHIVFIAGFALLTLSVALHVSLAHGGREDLVFGKPWQVSVYAGLIAIAVVLRAIAHFDSGRRLEWLGLAGAAFLSGAAVWATLALPAMFGRKTC